MSFVVINDGFTCEYCGTENPPAVGTCRNHCISCLCSRHLDKSSPGDRLSTCLGKMVPIEIKTHSKHEWVVLHECEKCGKQISNKIADDDSREKMAEIMSQMF